MFLEVIFRKIVFCVHLCSTIQARADVSEGIARDVEGRGSTSSSCHCFEDGVRRPMVTRYGM